MKNFVIYVSLSPKSNMTSSVRVHSPPTCRGNRLSIAPAEESPWEPCFIPGDPTPKYKTN